MTTTRGVRNNNPGNIDFNSRNDWVGQLGLEEGVTKPRFARFDLAENGIRALGKLILNYRGKDGMPGVGKTGIDTVKEVITRWAPGNENNTEAYINAVAQKLGVSPTQPLDLKTMAVLLPLTKAIIAHENAGFEYPAYILQAGVQKALA